MNIKSVTKGCKLLLVAAMCVFIAPATSKSPVPVTTLTFGLYASSDPVVIYNQFRPVIEELEQRVSVSYGQPVDINIALTKTYEEGIDAIVAGSSDFTRTGPASYLTAKRRDNNIQMLAMESVDGSKVFYGVIAVHENSDIKTVHDLHGKTFAFGDPTSTIGRWLSQRYLADNNIHSTDLSKHAYLGRHDRVGLAVAWGDFDAGALNETTFNILVERGIPIRALAKFPNVTKPWFAGSHMDASLVTVIKQELLKMSNSNNLSGLQIDGFQDSKHTDYETIERAIYRNSDFFDDDEALVD